MSLARYAAKLAALLGSDGKIPTAGIGDLAVTAAKLHTTAVTDKLGYTPKDVAYDNFPVRISDGFLNPFDAQWSGAYATITYIQTVVSGTVWSSRNAEEQALLTAMGRSGNQYNYGDFKIARLTWASGRAAGGYLLPYIQIPQYFRHPITAAAFVKWESGSLPAQSWCTGLTKNGQWTFCQETFMGNASSGYTHCHPYQDSTTTAGGSILVAMPGVWVGKLKDCYDIWNGVKGTVI